MATDSDDELEYLSSTFDPSTLTVPRLRSILVQHDIPYTASAKKAQLIDIFNQKLVPQSRKILAAKSRTKRTSRGITDMPSSQEGTVNGDDEDTGLMPPPPKPDTSRRKSKKSPRASTEDSADDLTPAKPTSSGRKISHKHARPSDSEGAPEVDERPIVRKSRRSDITPTVKVEYLEESRSRPPLGESVFSHDNPFQSGSSPLTASETRRKSAGTSTDKRKSTSRRRRTDGVIHDAAHVKQEDGVVVPTSRTFEVPISRLKSSKVKQEPEELEDTIEAGEEFTPEEQLELVRARAANGEVDILPPRRKKKPQKSSGVASSAPWVFIMTLLTGYAFWFRKEKIEVGYCGIGKPSTTLANAQVPEWANFLQPVCEPCPQHAFCYADMEARCERDFVLKTHPLSLGGLVPLPPSCEPDGEKVRKIQNVADKAVSELRERKAKFECGYLAEVDGKPSTLEIDETTLKTEVSQKRRKGMSEAEFEELWKGALGEIMGREEVTSDIDGKTHLIRFSSSSLARLPLTCTIRRHIRLTLARYRIELASVIILVAVYAYIRNHYLTLRADTARVPVLVSTTLNRLATQAALHAQNTVLEPWISIGQMRDDVLRDEFSAQRREAIWKRVVRVVETNANVRTSQRESRSGDVSKVWEWIGSFPALEDGRREGGRYSLGPALGSAEQRDSPRPEKVIEQRHWDEGRPVY